MSAYDFLLANIYDFAPFGDDLDPHVTTQEDDEPLSTGDITDMRLINAVNLAELIISLDDNIDQCILHAHHQEVPRFRLSAPSHW
jgi:hypothetical protein